MMLSSLGRQIESYTVSVKSMYIYTYRMYIHTYGTVCLYTSTNRIANSLRLPTFSDLCIYFKYYLNENRGELISE